MGKLSRSASKSSLLQVLPNESPLRSDSVFLAPTDWSAVQESEQPRALRGLSRIVDGGLCHRCGSCVGICPTGVLALDDDEYPTVQNLSACTDCDLCVKVCPGDEFDFEAMHRAVLGVEGELTSTHGHFLDAHIAYSTNPDIRKNSTSGGLVTGILLNLMKRGEIDGAVVIVSDDKQLWKGKPIVARTPEEILAAMKSKYAISPTNSVFSELLQQEGRYALVGLPCQIHGFIKAAELDARLKERVVLTIGIFCHAAIEHDAFRIIWDSLGSKTERTEKFVSRIGKHPGAPHLVQNDGSQYPVYFGHKNGFRPSSMEIINILYRLYTPARCLTCFDGLAEFADIAVGDPWMAPPEDDVDFYDGWSFALIRTERGQGVYGKLLESGEIESKTLTRKEALSCNKKMSSEKRWRAFRVMETHRRQGKSIPSYGPHGLKVPRHGGKHFILTEGNMLSHVFCFIPKLRAPLLRFFLGEGGYWLLWLNNKRRRLKFWLRDSVAGMVRRTFGRR